jgi:hypothetical protein
MITIEPLRQERHSEQKCQFRKHYFSRGVALPEPRGRAEDVFLASDFSLFHYGVVGARVYIR